MIELVQEGAAEAALIPMGRQTNIRDLIPLVVDATTSPNTQRAYTQALEKFTDWYEDVQPGVLSKAVVRMYLKNLARKPATHNQALSAIRKLIVEAADNGLLDYSTAAAIKSIPARKQLGSKTKHWLKEDSASDLVSAPDVETLRGKRDRVLIGLLLECGLRREEAAALKVEQLQEHQGRLVIENLKGKGGRVRTVAVPDDLALAIDDWVQAAKISKGRLLRAVNKADRLEGTGISTVAVYKQIAKYAADLGVEVQPHDLRRTFGRLTLENGADLEQIRQALGHSSIKTTEIYLGIPQALGQGTAPCDHLPQLEKRRRKPRP